MEENKNCQENRIISLTEAIKKVVDKEQLGVANILSVCISLMQIVETYLDLSGLQRKDLVIQVLTKFIRENQPQDVISNSLLDIIPSFIDSAVSLSKGKITIQDVATISTGCCLGICSFFQSKK